MISAKQICENIKKIAEQTGRNAAATIPAIVMLCSLAKRPGLSTIVSVINIIQKWKQFGIPTGENADGSPNMYIQIMTSIVDETYRALREDANVQIANAPGIVSIIAKGANAGGDITVTGTNINPFKGVGLIQ